MGQTDRLKARRYWEGRVAILICLEQQQQRHGTTTTTTMMIHQRHHHAYYSPSVSPTAASQQQPPTQQHPSSGVSSAAAAAAPPKLPLFSTTTTTTANDDDDTGALVPHHHHHPHTVQHQQHQQHRHLTLTDLIGLGVGGTVGSGLFVLVGQLAATLTGSATWCAMLVAGLAASLSAAAFAELAAKLPTAGSTYRYVTAAKLGSQAAVLAAACLTLEYAVAGAAVARTWGDKLIWLWLESSSASIGTTELNTDGTTPATGPELAQHLQTWMQPVAWLNLPAFVISAASTTLLLAGVQESKNATNIITAVKMILVVFMITGGFYFTWWKPPPPPLATTTIPWAPQGITGIVRGATSSFFGYLGYDEVCCVAGEAKHPVRDMPRAVLGTLGLVTTTYILASIALTGMVSDPANDISPTSGFPSAFEARDWYWAAQLSAWGEVMTLPVVVLISLLAQPRLTYSMALDGILPSKFAQQDETGNLTFGTQVAGIFMTFTATFVPFTYLDDLISAGILVAFVLTNCSLIVLRRESPMHQHGLLQYLLVVYNAMCFVTAILWSRLDEWKFPGQSLLASVTLMACIVCVLYIAIKCPPVTRFGGTVLSEPWLPAPGYTAADYFSTPWVPFWPCCAMALNWYLIAQLEWVGLMLLVVYLGAAASAHHLATSRGSNIADHSFSFFRRDSSYQSIEMMDDHDDDHQHVIVEKRNSNKDVATNGYSHGMGDHTESDNIGSPGGISLPDRSRQR